MGWRGSPTRTWWPTAATCSRVAARQTATPACSTRSVLCGLTGPTCPTSAGSRRRVRGREPPDTSWPTPQPGRVNRTPRIAAATMEPLLAWALRVVEDIGPDIRDAWVEYRRLDDGTHPTHEKYHGLLMRDRIELFVEQATREGAALPGHRVDGRLEINWNQLGRILGRWSSWPPALRRRIHAAGLPIAEGSPIGCVNGRVDGRPWRDGPIRAQEFPLLIRVLVAACFITTCYLSGMRPGEKRAELRLIQHSTTGTTG